MYSLFTSSVDCNDSDSVGLDGQWWVEWGYVGVFEVIPAVVWGTRAEKVPMAFWVGWRVFWPVEEWIFFVSW